MRDAVRLSCHRLSKDETAGPVAGQCEAFLTFNVLGIQLHLCIRSDVGPERAIRVSCLQGDLPLNKEDRGE